MFKTITTACRNSNNKQRFYLFLICAIAWMGLIFYFSAQPGNESSSMSEGVIRFLEKLFHIAILNQGYEIVDFAQFLVRKAAHSFVYFVLAILFYHMFQATKYEKKKILLALLCSFLYACSDEFHQVFIPGRAGMLQDVMIDTCGACAGLLCTSAIYWLHHQRTKKLSTKC